MILRYLFPYQPDPFLTAIRIRFNLYWFKKLPQITFSLLIGIGGFITLEKQTFASEHHPQNSDINLQPTLEQLQRYSREGRGNQKTEQVTSVSQLSDVQPTDWAFQSLQSLVERFGCIAGYPNGTYLGNRSLTRYEFAAGVNACLERIQELIQTAPNIRFTQDELEAWKRLQNEFAAELSLIRGEIYALENRTDTLTRQQFSTTTKLSGEAIFAFSSVAGNNQVWGGQENNNNNQAVFQNRVRLNLNTSFTGEDLLLTRLTVGNSQPFELGTAEGTQTFNIFGDTNNQVDIERLYYQFPANNKLNIIIAAKGATWDDFIPTVNPYLEDQDGGNGSLSAFGQRNPIYRLGGGAGIGLNYRFNDNLTASFGYLSASSSDANSGNGLFNGDYATLAQITVNPTNNFQFAFTYNHGYSTPGNFGFNNGVRDGVIFNRETETFNLDAMNGYTGTAIANSIYGLTEGTNSGIARGVSSHSYGVQFAWQIHPKFTLSAWGGYTVARVINTGEGHIWNYALTLAFPDLFKEGNLGGIIVGREPYLSALDAGNLDRGLPTASSWHFEVFYNYRISDNISITPGLIWITNPNQDSRNDDFVIGTLRTTFSF